MRTAIDTNVLSAIWSKENSLGTILEKLDQAIAEGALAICPVVWAEAHAYPGISANDIERFLQATDITVDFRLEQQVWQQAAERFRAYATRRRKSNGDSPRRLLTDFLVGAHALVQADRLLTLDAGIYRRNFPELPLL